MTHTDDIETPGDFQARLSDLVFAAADNGVDPRGVWQYDQRDGEGAFEIEIVELDIDATE